MNRDHGQGTIIARGPGVWLLRLSYGTDPETGKRVREAVTVHGTKREAEKRLRQLLAAKEAHQHPTRARKAMTTGAWVTTWLDGHPMAPQTRQHARDFWRLYASDRLRATPLRNLTPAFIRDELRRLRETVSPRTKRVLAGRTVGYFHGILRAALELARSDGLIVANPAAALRRPKEETRCQSARAMTLEQAKAFLTVAEADDLAALWRLLLEGGLRPAEALGLKWDDVQGDTVTVRHALVRVGKAWELRPTKTHQQRPVTLTPRAVELLDAHEKRQTAERESLRPGRWQDTGLVFTDPIGRPLPPWVVTKAYKRLVKAAGLVGFRVYDLRHSMASVALEGGEDIADVSKRLGHARVSTTADTYVHVSSESQRAVATRMSRLLG